MSEQITRTVKKSWAFRSSNGVTLYQTLLYDDGQLSCDCPGWTKRVDKHNRRSCKHTRFVDMGVANSQAVTSVIFPEAAEAFAQAWTAAAKATKQPKAKPAKPSMVRAIELEDPE